MREAQVNVVMGVWPLSVVLFCGVEKKDERKRKRLKVIKKSARGSWLRVLRYTVRYTLSPDDDGRYDGPSTSDIKTKQRPRDQSVREFFNILF